MSRPEIAPQEVIRRSVIQSHLLESVIVAVSGSIRTTESTTLSGSYVLQGILYRGGESWSADASFAFERVSDIGHQNLGGRLEALAPGDGVAYIRFNSLTGMLADSLSHTVPKSLLADWWIVPELGSITRQSGTPDPEQIDQLASQIEFVKDLGMTRIGKRDQYHYEVKISTQVLGHEQAEDGEHSRISGELWIDADMFTLRRAVWTIEGMETQFGPLALTIDAVFSRHNAAPLLQVRTGSASVLPLNDIFAIFW